MKENICKYCEHKWLHAIGGMCPSCYRFQMQVVEHRSSESQMIFNYPTEPYPLEAGLHPKQQEARDLAIADLRTQGHTILRIGQRGGKTFLCAEIARLMERKMVYIFDNDEKGMSRDFYLPNYYCGDLIPDNIHKGEVDWDNAIAIINEAFWLTNSFAMFSELREVAPKLPVIVIGANGPEHTQGWSALSGHSYASWEINPRLNEKDMRRSMVDNTQSSHDRFERDFGRF